MNWRKLLPIENFVLITQLPVEEVHKRLNDKVEPISSKSFSFSKQKITKPYQGQVWANTFSISRIIHYRNSFLPDIVGHVTPHFGETQIKVNMRPVTFVLIFMSLWLGIVGLVCIGITINAIAQIKEVFHEGFSPIMLIPYGMFVFGFLLITLGFKAEANQSKEFLAELFEAKEVA